mmetsp:Transcript_25719/g.48242  ORF Transcript_25719/g.48242 Transcript_25719/m.48242 type:complete len:863 (-) Transcript_25719:324-2912(-)
MNSVTERWVRSLKEKVLCMLIRSSLPVAFWWLAVECASYLLNRVPTKTVAGYMTPFECITGVAPDLKWLRIWGCKCYSLKPIAERKKDFDDKAYSGFLVGYAEQNTGYRIFVPALDKTIVSVHVIFNEIIPDTAAEYFADLDQLKIEAASEAKDVAQYQFLVGQKHLDSDDGLVYEATRVVLQKRFIVVYRRLVTASDTQPREEKTPIHVADVVRMTQDLQNFPPPDESVSVPFLTPTDAPAPRTPAMVTQDDPRREEEAHRTPSDSSDLRKSWNSQGRLATNTPPEKRKKLSISGSQPVHQNLHDDFMSTTRRRSRRGRQRQSNKEANMINYIFLLCFHMCCPQSYKQALVSPDYPRWQESMDAEIKVLAETRKCWEIVPYPRGKHNILRCHFVYKIKMKEGKVERYKSRLVVNGSQQIYGVDVGETFAPVVKYTTLRVFLAIVAVYCMCVHQVDVESAFPYADLEEIVYMHPHPEMKVPKGHCLRLLKNLYGLKQAPRNWNRLLSNTFLLLGFTQSSLDHGVYIGEVNGDKVIVAIFVDDVLIASASLEAISNIKAKLAEKFTVKDMGLAKEFLSIRIRQSRGRVTIDQYHYILSLLGRFAEYVGTKSYAHVPTMSDFMPREEGPATEKQQAFVDAFPFSAIVGCLLYLAVVTRFDICYPVGVLTRHLKCPTYAACKGACRVLNYLAYTPLRGICYTGSRLNLHAFCDSDWASDKDTRRSTSGVLVLMAGSPVSWLSKLQPIVAVSSMEAEYIACFYAVQEIVWIRQLLEDVGLARSKSTEVSIDNSSARLLALNPVYHQRSKHIDIKYHWLRDKVADGSVDLLLVSTVDQRADFLTKHVNGLVFNTHTSELMVTTPAPR